MAQTVIGMFASSEKAQNAVQELVQSGISRDNIDVSASNTTGSSYSSSTATTTDDDHESGVSKFFKSLFGDDDNDADKYTRVASSAQSIVTVHAQSGNEAEKVADILDDNGAVDVDEHASALGYGSTGTGSALGAGVTGLGSTGISDTDYPNTTVSTGTTAGYTGTGLTNDITGDETSKIPIIEENLAVGKREVTTGGVRLRSRIVERPVEESLRLREERVSIERTTVNRPVTADDLANFQEKNIEMVERAEVPVVSKEARVVEEVSLGKTVEERSETIKDTVRKTEVDVENIESNNLKDKFTSNNL